MSPVPPDDLVAAGFRTFSREQWAALAPDGPDDVYRPLCRLLGVVAAGCRDRTRRLAAQLDTEYRPVPFVVGVTGGVAAGKTTVAGRLRELLDDDPMLGPAEVLSTDSFLFGNEELARRNLAMRKGFPESYDRSRLLTALASIRGGDPEVAVPVYSHEDYDIVPGRHQVIARPAVLIVEGLDVLQVGSAGPGTAGGGPVVSDFLDWSIYLDAHEVDLARWHRQRLLAIHRSGTAGTPGFLGWFCSLSEAEAAEVAEQSWWGVNSVNLRQHIAPSRVRASMVLLQDSDHRVSHVRVRLR